MAIPKTSPTSNPVVADELATRPYPAGDRAGDWVAPDYPVDAEIVDKMTSVEHKLHLDDIRAAGAPAKTIVFENPGALETISVVEHAQKSTMDSRTIEDAGRHGVQLVTDRAELHRNDVMDIKEYTIAGASTNAAVFGANHKEDGANFATVDLVKKFDDVQEYIKRDGRMGKGRFGLIGPRTFRAARVNDGFKKYCASNPGLFGVLEAGSKQRNLIALASYLELDEIRIADYSRIIGEDTALTDFWPLDFMLVFTNNRTVSNKTFMQTVVVPYGQYQNVAQGTMVDVRTEPLPGTDRLTEVGAYHRYRQYLCNADMAFLFTGVLGWA